MSNKKLIALAVAVAFATPVAMANVTLYGKVHADIKLSDDGNNKKWSINSNTSRLGFKGKADLGNGMQAIFKYETCLLYTSPSPRDLSTSRMPSSA